MNITRKNKDTTIFTFDNIEEYNTHVFLIEKKNSIYLIDKYCGSESSEVIIDYIESALPSKNITVMNTHFHWDHIWGNISFRDKTIVSHCLCRDLSQKHWDSQISENKKYILGDIEPIFADITFDKTLCFPEDGIELFHSPGHSDDSISIYDNEKKILYVGDNIEKPIVYFEGCSINTYIDTLENYKRYDILEIHGSHTLQLQKEDIDSTIDYLNKLKTKETLDFSSAYENKVHNENLRHIDTLIRNCGG